MGYLSTGSLSGESLLGVSIEGVSVQGVSVWGEGPLSRGVSVRETPPCTVKDRAVHILLEYFFVQV